MIFNSQFVANQVCKAYLRLQSIKDNETFEKSDCSKIGKNLYKNYIDKYKHYQHCISHEGLRIVSRGSCCTLDLIKRNVIQDLLGQDILLEAVVYNRFITKNILFHSLDYTRMYKRNNSIAKTKNTEFIGVLGLFEVSTPYGEKHYIILGKQFEIKNKTLCKVSNFTSAKYLFLTHSTENMTAVMYPDDIDKKCIMINLCENENDEYCIIPLVNSIETD